MSARDNLAPIRLYHKGKRVIKGHTKQEEPVAFEFKPDTVIEFDAVTGEYLKRLYPNELFDVAQVTRPFESALTPAGAAPSADPALVSKPSEKDVADAVYAKLVASELMSDDEAFEVAYGFKREAAENAQKPEETTEQTDAAKPKKDKRKGKQDAVKDDESKEEIAKEQASDQTDAAKA